MRRAGKIILWVVVAWAGLMLVTGLSLKVLLSGSRLQRLLAAGSAGLPVPVSVGGGNFDLASWFRFQPAVALDEVRIGNPPGFSGKAMLEARRASATVELLSLLGDEVHVKSLVLAAPAVTVERNARGVTNVEVLLGLLAKQGKAGGNEPGQGKPRAVGVKVDTFSLRRGSLHYQGPGTAPLTVRDISLVVTNFAAGRPCEIQFRAGLFGSPDSMAAFTGQAGPFGGKALPASGKLVVELAPGQISEALRAGYFGDLLRAPGNKSRVRFEALMKGDLTGVFRGAGKLTLAGIHLGRDAASRMALAGEAPLQMTLRRLLTRPSFQVVMRKGSLSLGDGRWDSDATVFYDGNRVQGVSTGSIRNIEINQLLSTFFSLRNVVFGRGEVPVYQLRFSGANARQIRNSLSGEGRVSVSRGHLALFDLVSTIGHHAERLLSGDAAAKGATDFLRFQSNFQIRQGRILFSDPVLASNASRITGAGYITFGGELHFDLTAMVKGGIARLLRGRRDASGQMVAAVPLRIRGTVDNPKVRPKLTQVAVKGALSILDRFLGARKPAGQQSQPAPRQ